MYHFFVEAVPEEVVSLPLSGVFAYSTQSKVDDAQKGCNERNDYDDRHSPIQCLFLGRPRNLLELTLYFGDVQTQPSDPAFRIFCHRQLLHFQ